MALNVTACGQVYQVVLTCGGKINTQRTHSYENTM